MKRGLPVFIGLGVAIVISTTAYGAPKHLILETFGNGKGVIIEPDTGAEKPLVIAPERPDDCPPDGYWSDRHFVTNCQSGLTYRSARDEVVDIYKRARIPLNADPKPPPGTDDPGPSDKNSPKEEKQP